METVLVINPGSTSTKLALLLIMIAWQKKRLDIASKNWPFENVVSQTPFRKQMIAEFLETHNITQLAAVVGRGGLLKPIPGGTYLVDQQMLEDLRTERFNTHASNLGAILANEFAENITCQPLLSILLL